MSVEKSFYDLMKGFEDSYTKADEKTEYCGFCNQFIPISERGRYSIGYRYALCYTCASTYK